MRKHKTSKTTATSLDVALHWVATGKTPATSLDVALHWVATSVCNFTLKSIIA